MGCLDAEIKNKLNFKKAFQIITTIEFEIHSKRKKLKFHK